MTPPAPWPARFSLLPAAALLLAACGTTSKTGEVGETLSAGGLHATVIRVQRRVPRTEGRDYSGLGTPTPGTRFIGVKARVCNDRGNAIGAYDFALELAGGGKARLRFPQSVYSNEFDSVRTGCGGGWIVFEAPKRASAQTVTFKYDDTGSAQASGRPEKHARFRWKLQQ